MMTIPKLLEKKQRGEPIVTLTCYDHAFARILNQTDIDLILVGDSLGMVVQGKETTLPVTVDEIIYHTQMVCRGADRPLVIADMPFMSYQASVDEAVANAGRLIKEGGAQAVKLEGGEAVLPIVKRLVSVDIPVVGHLGLTPQSVHKMGGYKIQGKTEDAAQQLLKDALALEEAGASLIFLEGIPAEVAQQISTSLKIPTIGIGSGPHCDGQVLVINDLLGMDKTFKPKFVRYYASLEETILAAVKDYSRDVRDRSFPSAEESFHLSAQSRSQPRVVKEHKK